MCFGGQAKVDNTIQKQMQKDAREARRDEKQRQQRIRTGTENIDNTFGQFDDGFFNQFRDNYLSLYQPDLNDQYRDAKDELTYAFARAGTLNSSMAGEKLSDLLGTYNKQQSALLADAGGAASDLRTRVNNERSGLVNLLNATGDADRAANEALASSKLLFQEQPKYNALGDIFAGFATGIGNAYAGMQDRNLYNSYFNGSGSSRVVKG